MSRVRVKEIESGMVLSEDVVDKNGRFLLGKGCELASKHIRAFLAWGVSSVEVEGDDAVLEQVITEVPDDVLEKIELQISARFLNSNLEHPFIKALMDKAVAFKVREYTQQGAM